jgi:hypothetical protein
VRQSGQESGIYSRRPPSHLFRKFRILIVRHIRHMKTNPIFPIASLVAALITSGLYPLAQLFALVPWGTGYVLEKLLFIGPACIILSIILAILSAVFAKGIYRKALIIVLVAALLILPRSFAFRLGNQFRHKAFVHLAESSKPLIAAIERYKQHSKELPKSLMDLVPEFIASVPGTGMAAYPAYTYIVEEQGRAYALVIPTPNAGILNLDEFRYASNGEYPNYGKYWEPIGEWKYYHE